MRRSSRVQSLLFDNSFVRRSNDRSKQDDLRVMGNLCRFHDIKYDTDLHHQFTTWIKKKEIKWSSNTNIDCYKIATQTPLKEVLVNLGKMEEKYRIFGLFVLVSGLRTGEAIVAFNNHSKICHDGIMEMFWDRNTKKTNVVYCHPSLHDKLKFKTSESSVRKHLHSSILGCEIRYLRKLNYTINATKIDPLLAEFMQGRRGNISQRHYFLPLMSNNQKKWEKVWRKTLNLL